MKLMEIKKLYSEFTVGDLNFKIQDIDLGLDETIVSVDVFDNGGLVVGKFTVDIDSRDNSHDYSSHPDYPKTLDKLSYSSDTATISLNIHKFINNAGV